jgi:DNA-binding CsgD family transcriptional regulator
MLHANSKHLDLDGMFAEPFWSLFDESRIPMALVDSERRYVKLNDALLELYEYPAGKLLGNRAGWGVVDQNPAEMDAEWQRLLRTSEVYGEQTIAHANGNPMRVSYAAHATTVNDEWMALFVTLSARFHDGHELIGNTRPAPSGEHGAKLTAREREVVRLVSLGLNTRRIAAELSLSPDTVRSHVRNAMAKTGAHTRAHLVALVMADGLVSA